MAPPNGSADAAPDIGASFAAATQELVVDATRTLFEAYGVGLLAVDAATFRSACPLAYLSVIKFVGPAASGTMVLGATEAPLRASNAFGTSNRDWIGELSNQLFGRLKNRLLRHGVELWAVPPAVLSGENLEPVLARPGCAPVFFSTPDGGVLCVWIEVEATRPLVLDEVGQADIPSEGDVILF